MQVMQQIMQQIMQNVMPATHHAARSWVQWTLRWTLRCWCCTHAARSWNPARRFSAVYASALPDLRKPSVDGHFEGFSAVYASARQQQNAVCCARHVQQPLQRNGIQWDSMGFSAVYASARPVSFEVQYPIASLRNAD